MTQCRFRVIENKVALIDEDRDASTIDDAWVVVFDLAQRAPSGAILEVTDGQGEKVISVGASVAKMIKQMRASRSSAAPALSQA